MSYLKSQGPSRKALVDTFTGTGTVGPFTLSRNPGTKSGIIVQVGAGLTGPDTYTLSGTSLTFSGPIAVGTKVYIYHLGVENAVDPNRTVTLREFTFVATEGQTTFSGADKDGKVLAYRVGNLIVDVSGDTVQNAEDFEAIDGSQIIFMSGLPAGAEVHVFSLPALDIANVFTKDEVSAMVSRMIQDPLGTVQALMTKTVPNGWAAPTGECLLVSSYPDFVTECYVGDADNATAHWFYRCTDPNDADNTRDIAGDYIKLPNLNGSDGAEGLFLRGWNPSSARDWATLQEDDFKAHQHHSGANAGTIVSSGFAPRYGYTDVPSLDTGAEDTYNSVAGVQSQAVNTSVAGGDETRPRNVPVLLCLKIFHPTRVLAAEPEGVNKAGDTMETPLSGPVGSLPSNYVNKAQLDAVTRSAFAETDAYLSTYEAFTYNSNLPQSNQGTEFLTLSFTPSKAGAVIEIDGLAHIGTNPAGWVVLAAFYDLSTEAIATGVSYMITAGGIALVNLRTRLTLPTADSVNFSLRFGRSATSNTVFLNGDNQSARFGITSSLLVKEVG